MAEKEIKTLSEILESNEIVDGNDPIFSSAAIYEIIKEFIKRLKDKRQAVNGQKNVFVVYWDDIEESAGDKLITK